MKFHMPLCYCVVGCWNEPATFSCHGGDVAMLIVIVNTLVTYFLSA